MALVIYRKLAALVAAAMASGLAASCTTPAGRPTVTENPTIDRTAKSMGGDQGRGTASSSRGSTGHGGGGGGHY